MNLNIEDIMKACISNNAKLVFGNNQMTCNTFSKDTRTIKSGDVYIGIKGENFDGNTLYADAFEKGASVCILQGMDFNEIKNQENKFKNKSVILVDDTIKALQEIASYKRSLYNIPVIAVTGSVGKTSTKDIIASVVNTKYKVCKTEGNLNNHIGLPLTILGLEDHEALVVEMGMNNFGEISTLSKIAKPNIGVITNVGTAHIGNLGSRENIRKAKLEILDGMQENGILIINNDNDMLHNWYESILKINDNDESLNCNKNTLKNNNNMINNWYNEMLESEDKYKTIYVNNKKIKVITYGIENTSNIMAKDINIEANSSCFNLVYHNMEFSKNNIYVPIGGLHFVYNALCAIAVGLSINIEVDSIKTGIEKFELSKNRMELKNLANGAVLINDCYNANYDSMKAGIEYLAKTAKDRKIAVLGDMLELGEYSCELHKKVGEEVLKNKIDVLITVGEMGKVISETVNNDQMSNTQVYACNTNEEAINILQSIINSKDTILVKASNGMKFKNIVERMV